MKHLLRDIAKLTPNQWLTLISLLVMLNMVVMGALLWFVSESSSPSQYPFRQVVLAQAESTRTPFPTFTPMSAVLSWSISSTALPTPTNTRVPTWTPTITPTPMPTNTPTATPTPLPTDTPAVRRAVAPPTDTPTPTPSFDYVGVVRQLTPCENQGKHHIFVHVEDINNQPIVGAQVEVSWNGGLAMLETGTKIEDPSLADFAMFKGTYFVKVMGANSQIIGPITPDIPRDERCAENDNPVGNSFYHYSYDVIFTKVR